MLWHIFHLDFQSVSEEEIQQLWVSFLFLFSHNFLLHCYQLECEKFRLKVSKLLRFTSLLFERLNSWKDSCDRAAIKFMTRKLSSNQKCFRIICMHRLGVPFDSTPQQKRIAISMRSLSLVNAFSNPSLDCNRWLSSSRIVHSNIKDEITWK